MTFDRNRATGVEFSHDGDIHRIGAGSGLSLGAIHTPKVLMQSSIGEQTELQRFGIPVIQHLPGVGQNLQDHPIISCLWEYQQPLALRNNGAQATYFWKSDPNLDTPDLQTGQGELLLSSPETAARFDLPEFGWGWGVGVVRPKSRGNIGLTGPEPTDPVQIEANILSHPDDLTAAIAGVQLCREIGNSAAMQPFAKREVMPGTLKGCRAGGLRPRCCRELLAPKLHRQDGPRRHVGG